MRRQYGFTLVEMVVTVAVLALILVIAMPSVAAWQGDTRIRNTADSLQNGLQIARAEAVKRNQDVSFWLVGLADPAVLDNNCTLVSNSGSWVVSLSSPVGHCADKPSASAAPKIVVARASGGGVVVEATQAVGKTPASSVVFNGFGRVTNSDAAAVIDVSGLNPDTSVNLRVLVSAGGLARICVPDRNPDDVSTAKDGKDTRKC
jgi:type IV fimbrial biogenesis protein FimT